MRFLYILLVLVIPYPVFSQLDTFIIKKKDSAVLETVKLGFAVPDVPAFKALGLDPSNVLRPSEAKDLALMFSNFRNDGNFVIPKNLAVEISPVLLCKPWYTLQQYRNSGGLRMLTKTRISAGTSSDQKTGVNRLAIGLRTAIIDKADYRTDDTLLINKLFPLQDAFTLDFNNRLEKVKIKIGIGLFAQLSESERDKIMDSIKTAVYKDTKMNFDEVYNKAIDEFKKEKWNAARMDFAYSLVLQSPDSLLGNVKVSKHYFWLVYATRPGRNNRWGQFLFGITDGLYSLNNKMYNEFTGNFRFYAGANKFKGFLEAQYQSIDRPQADRLQTLYTQLGVEANFFKGVWLHFGTGILNALKGNNKSQLLSNLNIYLTIPENFKFF